VKSIERFADTVSTLAFCQPVIVSVDGGSTRGCAIVTISDKCDAIINLEGLIDVAKEKTRITGLMEKKQQQLGKVKEAAESDKIPLPVREANKEKLTELETELIQLESALSTLSTMD